MLYSICEAPTPGTWGSHQLYLNELRKLSIESEKPTWLESVEFNEAYLAEVLAQYGELHCEYCGKTGLRIYTWKLQAGNKKDMATVDHFFPKSKYPNLIFEKNNFLVACSKCNSKKGDEMCDVSMIKHPYNKEHWGNKKNIYDRV